MMSIGNSPPTIAKTAATYSPHDSTARRTTLDASRQHVNFDAQQATVSDYTAVMDAGVIGIVTDARAIGPGVIGAEVTDARAIGPGVIGAEMIDARAIGTAAIAVPGTFGATEQISESALPAERDIDQEAREGIEAISNDILHPDRWSEKSISTWKNIFAEAVAEPGASEESIFERMNEIGTLFNKMTNTDRVGMCVVRDENGAHYHMIVSRDHVTLARNHLLVVQGKDSPTAINAGTFKAPL